MQKGQKSCKEEFNVDGHQIFQTNKSYDCSVGKFIWVTILDMFMFFSFIVLFFGLRAFGGNSGPSWLEWRGVEDGENGGKGGAADAEDYELGASTSKETTGEGL